MPVFPPGLPVTVVVNGRPLVSYAPAYLQNGRVVAPVEPLLVRLADRIWIENGVLVLRRDGRQARVVLSDWSPGAALADTYVPVGPLLRALGASVAYRGGSLQVRLAADATVEAASPVPSDALVSPRAVFTPQPIPTPRPVWTGRPLPRRTPLPLTSPAAG